MPSPQKTRPGTVTELKQSVSEPSMESVANSVSRDSAEVDDIFIESFQNMHIGTLLKVKDFCVNCFCSCPKGSSLRPKTDTTFLSKENDY
ncbi:hypothetical protein Y1Q_0004704 [Alligator mississippiensis]|uniref:Uncharacterized protein n=1 Tax=Alligator mississippiensis TaxID=8496 RepID=A0A151P7A6_ALLMI|nr:hypothetical protein Y1Q_0004704 [Alligator mississippiensis]